MNGRCPTRSPDRASARARRSAEPRERVAARRDDEPHRPVLAPERGAEAERRSAAARGRAPRSRTPSAGSRRDAAIFGSPAKSGSPSSDAENAPRVVAPGAVELGEPVVVLGRVRHVLAAALRARPRSTTVVVTRVNCVETSTDRRSVRELRARPTRGRAADPRAPSADRRLDLAGSARAHHARDERDRREDRDPADRPEDLVPAGRAEVRSREVDRGARRSARRAAARGPSSSSPSPETAPRCSRGISLKSRPQASVITVPPAIATGNDQREVPVVPGRREAGDEEAAAVDERREEDRPARCRTCRRAGRRRARRSRSRSRPHRAPPTRSPSTRAALR